MHVCALGPTAENHNQSHGRRSRDVSGTDADEGVGARKVTIALLRLISPFIFMNMHLRMNKGDVVSYHWRRQWQPTPVFLPGESWGRRSLVGCRLWVAQSWTRRDLAAAAAVSYHEPPSKAMYGANSSNFKWAQRDSLKHNTPSAIAGRGPRFGEEGHSPSSRT